MGGDLPLGVGPGLWVSRSVCAPGPLSRPLCPSGAGAWDCFLAQPGPWVSSLGSGDGSVSVCVHLPAVSCCYQGCVCTARGKAGPFPASRSDSGHGEGLQGPPQTLGPGEPPPRTGSAPARS